MFYVSDYHFEMIGLLNMRKDFKENKKIIILTQNDLTKTVNDILSRINLKDTERNFFEKINWKNKDTNNVKQEIIKNKNLAIYIKGNEEFIKNQNKKIKEIITKDKNITIIDCYNYFEIQNKIDEISKKYEKKLVTNA